MTDTPLAHWFSQTTQGTHAHSAMWRSENGAPPPKKILVADDNTFNADTIYRLACEGTAVLWQGDYQNARQMLQALTRRLDKRPSKAKPTIDAKEAFHKHRQAQAQRARILGMLLIPLSAQYETHLRRAPDVSAACIEAYGAPDSHTPDSVVSLREILGLIGAHEWYKKGVYITPLKDTIHPYYGVYSPVRGEYLDLIAQAPLPSLQSAMDVGTGTGVIAALLAKRGIQHVTATDMSKRALACARENLTRLRYIDQVQLVQANLFPEPSADTLITPVDLLVCNPPWLPAKANAAIEYALYDPDSQMLKGFLSGAAQHLSEHGEVWLIISDLAEHLQLRSRAQLLTWIEEAGLQVIDRLDTRPQHKKAFDTQDPLHHARSKEITSLWRLKRKSST